MSVHVSIKWSNYALTFTPQGYEWVPRNRSQSSTWWEQVGVHVSAVVVVDLLG